MRFFTQIAAFAAATATLVSANTITLINQDGTTRNAVFTTNLNSVLLKTVTVAGNSQQVVDIPEGWAGNLYAVAQGEPEVPGMLAEITFQGWNDFTYFDVSAIVKPGDTTNVKQVYPKTQLESTKTLVSGCALFPCATAYYHPEDIQTVVTSETDLIVTLGTSDNVASREVNPNLVARHYALGKLSP
ncbi:uncharacterized protein F4822DRAFT_427283 [Hypoxylon trugodes]|uniref:uncharacterized protein n=1 Tax=Hypoxylon trugodes TaxID=326681 RepID=UPI00219E5404|nr:uncharacterized protein F4822DRAFT_427283 [Hypoxylon trugodes]KAI1391431.1 hypothetical protein F4822DRAFT_427283 [Hypoxylon trugodes]